MTNEQPVRPKQGMEFEHIHWLDGQNKPLRCRITSIRHGTVYWRSVDHDGSLGSPYCVEADDLPSKVRRWLDAGDHLTS